MARVLQDAPVREQGGVEALHIVPLVDHGPPPGGFQVVLQFDAQGTVVVEALGTAVDVGGLEDESAALAQRDQFVHGLGGHGLLLA